MGKDRISDVLYAIGAAASLILGTVTVIYFFFPTFYVLGFVAFSSLIFIALGIIAIYHDSGNKISIISAIFFVLAILASYRIFDVLFQLLLQFLDYDTMELVVNWFIWMLWLVTYLLFGVSIWLTHNQVGSIAKIAGVVFMIWAVVELVLHFLGFGLILSIWHLMRLAGMVIIYLFAFIYFIAAIRS